MAFSLRAPVARSRTALVGGRSAGRSARAGPSAVSAQAVKLAQPQATAWSAGPAPRRSAARQVACLAAMAKKSVGDLGKAELEVWHHTLECLIDAHSACRAHTHARLRGLRAARRYVF